jgi:hypothetical protein
MITPQLLLTKQGEIIETEHKGGTKTKKKQGNNANKGAFKEPGTEKVLT